jgi:hypothetical protein
VRGKIGDGVFNTEGTEETRRATEDYNFTP